LLSQLRYIDRDNWHEIERQYIFEALVPFVPERPLDFFVYNHGSTNEGFITSIIEDANSLAEHKIVTTLKRRKVLLLTSDELCRDLIYPDVTIAKVYSIKPEHKKQEWYKLLVADQHPLYVYLPDNITGEECYIHMASATTIGKNMLIQKKCLIPGDRMELVEQRHQECIDLGVIKITEDEATG
jgi:hypothetical protein